MEEAERKESDDEEAVDSPPRSERRSKQRHDPVNRRGKAVASSAPSHKRARSPTPELTETVPKQPKANPSKARKALPRIKMDIPVASG